MPSLSARSRTTSPTIFAETLTNAENAYCRQVSRLGRRGRALENLALDTGQPTRGGEYAPADETYAALLEKLAERDFADVPPALRADILRF